MLRLVSTYVDRVGIFWRGSVGERRPVHRQAVALMTIDATMDIVTMPVVASIGDSFQSVRRSWDRRRQQSGAKL